YERSPKTMERAIVELAPLLGAGGSRPEEDFDEGPDDLWIWPNLNLVIEVKNQNQDTLHKSDAEQLLGSLQWFQNSYAALSAPVPVVVARMTTADRKSGFPDGTRVITPNRMQGLTDALSGFYQSLISLQGQVTPQAVGELQAKCNLTSQQFIG